MIDINYYPIYVQWRKNFSRQKYHFKPNTQKGKKGNTILIITVAILYK